LVFGRGISPASSTDRAALDTFLANLARQIDASPRDAALALGPDGDLQVTAATDGLELDVSASQDQITNALENASPNVSLVTRQLPPSIGDDQIQVAHEQLDRLFGPSAQPIVARFGQQTWLVTRVDLLKLVSVQIRTRPGQSATVAVDDRALRAWVIPIAEEIGQPVQEPRFHFSDGALHVTRPSQQGRNLDVNETVRAVHQALLAGQPVVDLPVSVTNLSVSSGNAQSLGITELIQTASTSFAGSVPEKKHNIQLAAQRLNGIVVPPGATFSFNDAVGPTTLDAGFQWGYGIESGNDGPRTVPSVAGGICQVATTLFQPVFWAGYQLEERYWHLYWIPAYTSRGVVGLDATVDEDAGLDLKWTNTTSHYVLIQSDTDDENVYFSLYGTKPDWTVKVADAIISNKTPPDPKPVAQPEPLVPWGKTVLVETARDGFDVEVEREVIPSDGSQERVLDLTSHYDPAQTVTLVGTGGAPTGANVEAALERALVAQNKPAPPAKAPTRAVQALATMEPVPAPAVAATAPIVATPTMASAAVVQKPTAAPKAGTPTSQPTPGAPPKVVATPKPTPRN
jgi:vancomycin resistance protein YoaR